jgi:hypothetical protein
VSEPEPWPLTLYQWAGGADALERLFERFYEKVVADDVGLPADPEFRSAFMAYIEWGTRIAVANSQPAATPVPHAPVPRWGWGEAPLRG